MCPHFQEPTLEEVAIMIEEIKKQHVTGVAALQANTVSSTELVSAVTLNILDSSGSTVKTIIGAGS